MMYTPLSRVPCCLLSPFDLTCHTVFCKVVISTTSSTKLFPFVRQLQHPIYIMDKILKKLALFDLNALTQLLMPHSQYHQQSPLATPELTVRSPLIIAQAAATPQYPPLTDHQQRHSFIGPAITPTNQHYTPTLFGSIILIIKQSTYQHA